MVTRIGDILFKRAFKIAKHKHFKPAILLVSCLLAIYITYRGAQLRWMGYDKVPVGILDEYNYVWQGLSIRDSGLPVAWVTFDFIYRTSLSLGGDINGFSIAIDQKPITLQTFKQHPQPLHAIQELDYGEGIRQIFFVAPFFDHPPLGGLIYSLGVHNAKTFTDVTLAQVRYNTLVLAVLTSLLLFVLLMLITRQPAIALIAVIIYNTAPSYLLASRTAYLENVIPPFILFHLILLFLSLRKNRSNLLLLLLSGLIGGVSVLAKESAAGFLLGSFFLLFLNRKTIPKRHFLGWICAVLVPILIYISWGMWLEKDIFLAVFQANSSRGFFGGLQVLAILPSLRYKGFPLDGWWVWGFISFLLVGFLHKREYLFVLIPMAGHFLIVTLFGSYNYPWYYDALIPFLASCGAIAIWEIIKQANWALFLAFFFIPFSSTFYWGRSVLHLPANIWEYRILFLLFIAAIFLRSHFENKKAAQVLWLIFFTWVIYQVFIWNERSVLYMIKNWNNFTPPALPGL